MHKLWVKVFFFVIVTLTFFSGISSAIAATDTGEGLQVSPAIINLNADKGGTYLVKLSVTNVTPGTLNVSGVIDDFTVKDETGAPKILEGKDDNLGPDFSFKSWAKQIGDIQLKPHETKKIAVTVAVPTTAESGGHYGIIRFSGKAPDITDQNVGLAASVGSLVLVRVAGNITEKLSVQDFYITKNAKKVSFTETGPIKFVTRFENTGNIHVKPTGLITVKNMFGKNVASLQISDSLGNVLPQSTRKFEQTLKNKWLFGKYTATLNATYGTANNSLLSTATFWAFPYKIIIIILISLTAIVFALIKIIKRYNARVIKKYSGK